jgi:predicted TIM-barrel fold metal-dependent hydrolase
MTFYQWLSLIEGCATLLALAAFGGVYWAKKDNDEAYAIATAAHTQEFLDCQQAIKAHARTYDNLGRNRWELSKRYDELCAKFAHVDLAKSAAEKEAEILRYDLGVVQADLANANMEIASLKSMLAPAKPISKTVKKIRSKK